jgi:hypothetical protein
VYGRAVTDHVLAASDPQELPDRLDALSGDPEFWQQEKVPPSPPMTPAEILADLDKATLDKPSLLAVLGSKAAARVEEGFGAWVSIARRIIEWTPSLQRLNDSLTSLRAKLGTPAIQITPKVYASPTDVLYDADIPLTLREEIAMLFFGLAAAPVIGRAEEHGKLVPPWQAIGLADAFARTPERIFANMRIERVAAILAAVAAMPIEQVSVREAIEQWRRDAEASGKDVYFPLGDADAQAE